MTTTPPKLADETRRVETLVTRRMTRRHRERLDLPELLDEPLVLNVGVTAADLMELAEQIYGAEQSSSIVPSEGRPDAFPSAAPVGPGDREVPRSTAGQRAIARVEAEKRRRYMAARRLPLRTTVR